MATKIYRGYTVDGTLISGQNELTGEIENLAMASDFARAEWITRSLMAARDLRNHLRDVLTACYGWEEIPCEERAATLSAAEKALCHFADI